jgi:hypothetical protein
MRYLLKSLFNQNSIIIHHKSNNNFKSHITLRITQDGVVAILVFSLCPSDPRLILFSKSQVRDKNSFSFSF